MKYFKFSLLTVCSLLAALSCFSQKYNWGVGLRAGDPMGITVKKYMENNALELNFGRTHLFGGKGYYNNRFDDWYLENKFGYKDFQYLGFKASVPIGFQLHYLIHKDIPIDDLEGLQWYFGAGGQLRFQTYTFDYRYKLEGNSEWFYSTGERVTDIDFGGDGVIGLEFLIPDSPITIFTDVNIFVEIFDNPFLFWFQAGIGGRYNF